ncbi:hypothetical protein [Streptomyces sp. NPDC002187]|uniref:hypothetical protein n=1 Tax=Streptomyces sp. NPDC002187 TaxID=3364637 RepID=UPI0036C83777
MEETKGINAARVAAIEASATMATAQWEYRQEEAEVQAIVAGSQAARSARWSRARNWTCRTC